jgi:hypothetical protein
MEEEVSRILSLSCLFAPPLWRRMSLGPSLSHTSPSSVIEADVSRILSLSRSSASVMEDDVSRILSLSCLFAPPLWRRMTPGTSYHHASPSSVLEEDISRNLSPSTSPSSVMEADVSRILSPSHLFVLRYGGGCLQDPLTITPLRPPLWRRMSPGSSHRHDSSSSAMEVDVSRILSPSRLFILCYGGGCLQVPLTVTPFRPPLWRRMSPGSSHRRASLSSGIPDCFPSYTRS